MPSSSTLNGHRRRWRSVIENDKDGMGRILAAYKYDLFDVCLLVILYESKWNWRMSVLLHSIPLHSIRFDSIVGCAWARMFRYTKHYLPALHHASAIVIVSSTLSNSHTICQDKVDATREEDEDKKKLFKPKQWNWGFGIELLVDLLR